MFNGKEIFKAEIRYNAQYNIFEVIERTYVVEEKPRTYKSQFDSIKKDQVGVALVNRNSATCLELTEKMIYPGDYRNRVVEVQYYGFTKEEALQGAKQGVVDCINEFNEYVVQQNQELLNQLNK